MFEYSANIALEGKYQFNVEFRSCNEDEAIIRFETLAYALKRTNPKYECTLRKSPVKSYATVKGI